MGLHTHVPASLRLPSPPCCRWHGMPDAHVQAFLLLAPVDVSD